MNLRSLVAIAILVTAVPGIGCASVVSNPGGSGGSAGTGGVDRGPTLELSSTEPADLEVEVEPSSSVRATFDSPVQADFVTAASLRVEGVGGVEVAGSVELDGEDTLVFVPDKRLSLLTEYTVIVDGGVRSIEGATLGSDASWTFLVRDGAWQGERLIGDGTQPSTSPALAIDDDENALVVWEWEPVIGEYSMWTNRSQSGLWDAQQLLETSDARGDFDPVMAMDFEGNAFAIWEAFQDVNNDIRTNLWIARFTRSEGSWSTPQRFESVPDPAKSAAIVFDPFGNALAIWLQNTTPTVASLWASRYDRAGDRWDAPELLETDDSGSVSTPSLAVDPEGNAMAVWPQSDGTRFSIWGARYDAATDEWAPPRRIELDNAGSASGEDVAMDPEGDAIAVWSQSDGTINDVWMNRYTRDTNTWGTPMRLDIEDAGNASGPKVGIDAAGNAVVVWGQLEGNRSDAWARHYDRASDTWLVPARIEDDPNSAGAPQLVVDPAGNAVAVWSQTDPGGVVSSVWTNRFAFGVGWGTPERLEAGSANVRSVRVGLSPTGTALAAWSQGDQTRVNRFD